MVASCSTYTYRDGIYISAVNDMDGYKVGGIVLWIERSILINNYIGYVVCTYALEGL